MISRLLAGCAFAALLPCLAFAGPAPVVRESVAVCDPNIPANCVQPNSIGQFPFTGAVTAVPGAYAAGSIVDLGTGASPAANTVNSNLLAIISAVQQPAQLATTTKVKSSSYTSNLVVTNTAAGAYSFNVTPDATLSASVWWLEGFDATSAPADGSVTPDLCVQVPAGAPGVSGSYAPAPAAMASGFVLVASTNATGCTQKTASAHAYFTATYK